jgi:hypothetical protein
MRIPSFGRLPVLETLLVASIFTGLASSTVTAAEKIRMSSSRKPGDLDHVEALLEVGGDLKLTEQGKLRSLKMSVSGKFSYDEKLLASAPQDAKSDSVGRSLRSYQVAEAAIKIEKGVLNPKLRSERKLIVSESSKDRLALFSPEGALSREELDLIELPANTLILDQLLPAEAVDIGGKWKHSDALVAALLDLDAVSQSEVTSTLKDADEKAARMELTGTVQGAVGGVATELELKGRYKFDLKTGRITWFALLVAEKRSVGHVSPGADVTARLQLTVAPHAAGGELANLPVSELDLDSPNRLMLEYRSPGGQFGFTHDRRWYVMSAKADGLAMRLVDRGELLAQCNVSDLPKSPPGQHPSLANFQEDIQKSLAKNFGQFVHAAESTTADSKTIYRVVAQGVVSDLPIQWIYYLVADPQGRQAVFAFTVETELAGRLNGADRSVVDTLEFRDPPATTAAKEPTLAPAKK